MTSDIFGCWRQPAVDTGSGTSQAQRGPGLRREATNEYLPRAVFGHFQKAGQTMLPNRKSAINPRIVATSRQPISASGQRWFKSDKRIVALSFESSQTSRTGFEPASVMEISIFSRSLRTMGESGRGRWLIK
jgi:hypothetical protein